MHPTDGIPACYAGSAVLSGGTHNCSLPLTGCLKVFAPARCAGAPASRRARPPGQCGAQHAWDAGSAEADRDSGHAGAGACRSAPPALHRGHTGCKQALHRCCHSCFLSRANGLQGRAVMALEQLLQLAQAVQRGNYHCRLCTEPCARSLLCVNPPVLLAVLRERPLAACRG